MSNIICYGLGFIVGILMDISIMCILQINRGDKYE